MNLFKNEVLKFSQTYRKIFFAVAGLAIIIILGTYFIMMSIGQETIDQFMKGIVDSLGGEEAIREKMKSQNNTFLFILQNNFRVSLIVLISGLIPFYFVTVLIATPSVAIIGVVLANAKMNGENPFWTFCTSILPHGTTEFTEFLIVVSMSVYLSHTITKKIFRREKKSIIWQQVKANLTTFLVLCVPLVVLSAAIEAFITPFFMKL